MLEIEGLNWSAYEIVAPHSLLAILSIMSISLFHLIVVVFKTNRRQVEGEDCLGLLKDYFDILLKLFDWNCLRVFLLRSVLLFLGLRLRVCLRSLAFHKLRPILEIRAASLHVRLILRIKRAFDLGLNLISLFSGLLTFGFKKFQILLCVETVLLGDETALFNWYSLGVLTLPSTTTILESISDCEVLVPLIWPIPR